MSLGEFEIIERYFARASSDPQVLVGIGDDAAVVETKGPIAVAVDTVVAGVHFPRDTSAAAIGHRVLAVNLSDFAAMGAEPRWCTLALTLPDADAGWLEAFAGGLFALAAEFGVTLIGGDLTRGPLTATLELLGPTAPDGLLTRAGGRVGDDVFVTGTLGDAAAGLALLASRAGAAGAAETRLEKRFLYPRPRVAAGRALAALAHAAIDVSDGLVADLGHICEMSGCAAEIEVTCLPLSEELTTVYSADAARRLALTGGDDYELCFSAPPAAGEAVARACEGAGTPVRRIGQLAEGRGVRLAEHGRPLEPPAGSYRHFDP